MEGDLSVLEGFLSRVGHCGLTHLHCPAALAYNYYTYYSSTPTTMADVYQGCSSGAPPMTVEELTIDSLHAQLLNGRHALAYSDSCSH